MIRVLLAGAGSMGQAWLEAIHADPGVTLAGVADLDLAAARRAAPGLPVGTDVAVLAAETGADAVIDVTVPPAHHPVTTTALFAGLPVLGEKPVADTLARALSLVAAAEVSGQLFMVSQSRRWNPQLFALRAMTGTLGRVGSVSTDFHRAPRFGGFREKMAQPLLVDMAIHAFDAARFLLGGDPVTVSCQTWNPPWSWYAGDACATAVFEMTGGARYLYHGSWCSPGAETSWNGEWRVSAEHGTARWDGDNDPIGPAVDAPDGRYSGIGGALRVFAEALDSGVTPMGEVHGNVLSLAMVEAAVDSATRGRPVLIDEVLARAHEQAVREETRTDVREALRGWTDVRATLGAA
ncbi:oxidoreductase [Actinoplanes sp. ATCC 53533]|uniref:Gfo/Idh/MocA family protein n=1 Tax=Actinoplanes sp. ATCC 53533 TaxID=1288362 RepID=UPI000F7B4C8C|nr:Gfo/Idh/MocA family oxidoreductase [Actinoplanes sp. ATCC 53533]RSM48356.1 oxidoreductase [Actinoplanes sp. ATCC 53533]